jgi:hypothetical protein
MNILSDINKKDREGSDNKGNAIEGKGDIEKQNKTISKKQSNTADGRNTNEMTASQRKR